MTADKPLSEVDFYKYMDGFKKGIFGKLNTQNRELGEVATELGNVKDDVVALEEKSDRFDRVNLGLIAIGTALGTYLK